MILNVISLILQCQQIHMSTTCLHSGLDYTILKHNSIPEHVTCVRHLPRSVTRSDGILAAHLGRFSVTTQTDTFKRCGENEQMLYRFHIAGGVGLDGSIYRRLPHNVKFCGCVAKADLMAATL